MIGSNEMKLNHACIVEAIQMWLDAQMKEGKSPVVQSVVGGGQYDVQEFVVKLADREEPA